MHKTYIVAIAAVLAVVAGFQVAAQDNPTNAATHAQRVIAVFVRVNAQGKVTRLDPAEKLEPALNALLRETVDKWITQPARDAHGKAIASRFIMSLSVQTVPLANGAYKAKLSYVSAQAVPVGHWYWIHAGKSVALARRDTIEHDQRRMRTTCVSLGSGGSGHRRIYIKNGVVIGREGDPCKK